MTKQAEAPATPKSPEQPENPPEPFPPIASGIGEDGLRWEAVSVGGTQYRVREITVDESDAAYDASENPDKTFNPRLNQRLELVTSIAMPVVTLDDIGKWSKAKLRALLYVSARVNTLPPADAEGNG